jgi:hypothetical protein
LARQPSLTQDRCERARRNGRGWMLHRTLRRKLRAFRPGRNAELLTDGGTRCMSSRIPLWYTACVLRHSDASELTVTTAHFQLDMREVPGGKRRRGKMSNVRTSQFCPLAAVLRYCRAAVIQPYVDSSAARLARAASPWLQPGVYDNDGLAACSS